jgi:hypothetical protein
LRRFGGILCTASAAALLIASEVGAQTPPRSHDAPAAGGLPFVPRTSGAIRVDGVLDEPFWAEALTFELDIETNPRENEPAPVRTTAYLIEDGTRLLVAFHARDPNPDAIRAYLRDRDSGLDDDSVGIVIDTFNDERRAFEFFVNALGVQTDRINDDVNGNTDSSWDAIWDSAGRLTDDGYIVEFAIPFSQLRFPSTEGPQTWGIDLIRFYPRENRHRLSINAQERGRNCYLCQTTRIRGFADARPGKDIEIVPSLTASRIQSFDSATNGLAKAETDSDVGVNVRWGITPNLTANLALNPDFSQVEADQAQLTVNNPFTISFPERRPFFLEGADYFDTPINAVFTRTVVDPDIGAKLTGRSGNNTFGMFAADDSLTTLLFPGPQGSSTAGLAQSNQTFVGRYSRGFGDASTVGVLTTLRSGDDYHNRVTGIDGRLRLTNSHNIRFQYLHSDTGYPEEIAQTHGQPLDSFTGSANRLQYSYNTRQWNANFNRFAADEGFRADSGFITRVDVEQLNANFERIWHGGGQRVWNQLRAGMQTNRAANGDGQLLERNLQTFFIFNGPMQSFMRTGLMMRQQYWAGELFDAQGVFAFGQVRPVGGLSVGMAMRRSEQVDFANARLANEVMFEPSFEWNANRHLLIRMQHTSQRFSSKEGPMIFDAQLTDLRMTWQFSVRSFVRLTLQRQRIERNPEMYQFPGIEPRTESFGSQFLYSYKLNPQTVVFAGYSGNLREDSRFTSRTETDRAFFIKMSYAWIP